jgi:hypothetical protein
LVGRLLKKCQDQHWYGGDKSNTARFNGSARYETFYTADGKEIIKDNDPDGHPLKTGFACAPASSEQLLATEQALGFPIPSLLRTIYAQLANGGFGPGYGLHGAVGGFDEAGNIVDGYKFHLATSKLIDLEEYAPKRLIGTLDLPDTVWPRYFIYLCDWDYATTSCLDVATGCVYLCRPSRTDSHSFTLLLEASSLQEWFEFWLQGELVDKGQYIEDPDEQSDKGPRIKYPQDTFDTADEDSLIELLMALDSESPLDPEDPFDLEGGPFGINEQNPLPN